MSKAVDLLLAKRRLSYRVAEGVIEIMKVGLSQAGQVNVEGRLDAVADVIYAEIPLTYAEAELEYERARAVETALAKTPGLPTVPSPLDKLRAALGYDATVGVKGTLEGAIEFITKHRNKP